MAAGQLLVVPLAMGLTMTWGWRTAFVVLGVGFLALVLPLVLGVIRNDPRDMGLRPYGAAARVPAPRSRRPWPPSATSPAPRRPSNGAVLAPGRELLGVRLHERPV